MIHPPPLIAQNIRSKHNYSFLTEISNMFRLQFIDVIRLIAKTKQEKFTAA